MVVDIRDVITYFKFDDDRFRGLASAEGQILPFPIDFDGRFYNTHTTVWACDSVIQIKQNGAKTGLSGEIARKWQFTMETDYLSARLICLQ